MELSGYRALVTGGTAGIGLACAELLAREGAHVTITGRDPQRGESAAAKLSENVRFMHADLSDVESVKSLAQQCVEVDIVVNNAASLPGALTVEQNIDSFERTFGTSVRGTYFLVGTVDGRHARTRRHRQRDLEGPAERRRCAT